MNKFKYSVDEVVIRTRNKIAVSGWVLSDTDYALRAVLGTEQKVDINKKNVKRADVQYSMHTDELNCGFKDEIIVQDLNFKKIEIQILYQGKWQTLYKKSIRDLMQESDFIVHHIDSTLLCKDKVVIQGWAFSKCGEVPQIKVPKDKEAKITFKERCDVYNAHRNILNHSNVGFEITITNLVRRSIDIEYSIHNYKVRDSISIGKLKKQRNKERLNKIGALIKLANVEKVKKTIVYLRNNGLKKSIEKLNSVLKRNTSYTKWIENQLPTLSELEEQRQYRFAYEPLISIVVPTYNTPMHFLVEMIESVLEQTYSNWQLCIADGNSQTPDTIKTLKEYQQKDKRIKVNLLKENLGISGNTNASLELATGDYIALLDHDDLLTPNALYEVVKVLNKDKSIDFIYSDEDKVDEKSEEFFDPHFKPDWSPDTLRSYNYICHFTVFKKSLLEQVGGFDSKFDGSQDYDMFLRLTEKTNMIVHIPKILYHWRVHKNSTACDISAKQYTIDAARRALEEHLKRIGLEGKVEPGLVRGTHRISYNIQGNPKVSIIIPTKDHIADLKKCIDSIKKSTYKNYEVILVENNSVEQETFTYYEHLKQEENIQIVVWKGPFNYSKINNFGVKYSTGEYIILLNNDIELITPNWIEEMLMHCQRQDVGIVGGKLYYPDDTVQHAGVIIGIGGVAGHSHKYYGREENGYFSRLKIIQNLSAVTAACLMIRKDVFDEVDGLEEKFAVAFNDVDLCLKVRKCNKLVIFTPYVEAYHYESKSRGAEDTPEKIERFNNEVKLFETRWGLYRRDPYYNCNLSLEKEDFSLKEG